MTDNNSLFKWTAPEKVSVSYKGSTFLINPFISAATQGALINIYVDTYFFNSDSGSIENDAYCPFEAEMELKSALIQTQTDIPVQSLPNDFFVDDSFWEFFESQIVNYKSFDDKLYLAVYDIKKRLEIDRSFGAVLDRVSTQVMTLLENYKEMTPEKIAEAKNAGLEMVSAMEKISPLLGVNTKKKPANKKAK